MKLIPLSGRRPDATWGVCATPVGEALLAFCEPAEKSGAFASEGVCWLSFGASQSAVEELRAFWKDGNLVRDDAKAEQLARKIFADGAVAELPEGGADMALLVEGTPFQLKVWQALMGVARGERITYTQLAQKAGIPSAVRSAATAIGRNNISYLIPCHRIVPAGSGVGQYRWGPKVKKALLDWELTLERGQS